MNMNIIFGGPLSRAGGVVLKLHHNFSESQQFLTALDESRYVKQLIAY